MYVSFQKDAWVTEEILLEYLNKLWKSIPNGMCAAKKLLLLDDATMHKTDAVKEKLSRFNTEVVYIPPGCTPYLQPVDVVFNKSFKAEMGRLSTQHMEENLGMYTGESESKLTASARRILITKFVGEAWQISARRLKESVAECFKTRGITVAEDGSEDFMIAIPELEDYEIGELSDYEDMGSDIEDVFLESENEEISEDEEEEGEEVNESMELSNEEEIDNQEVTYAAIQPYKYE